MTGGGGCMSGEYIDWMLVPRIVVGTGRFDTVRCGYVGVAGRGAAVVVCCAWGGILRVLVCFQRGCVREDMRLSSA